MKPIISCILILSIACQWLASHLVARVAHTVEVEHRMNAQEQSLAARLLQERGYEGKIRILNEKDIKPEAIGYGNFHIFSERINGQLILFTLVADTVEQTVYTQQNGLGSQDDQPDNALLERLFSKFTKPAFAHIRPSPTALPFVHLFPSPGLQSLFIISVPTPPPQAVFTGLFVNV